MLSSKKYDGKKTIINFKGHGGITVTKRRATNQYDDSCTRRHSLKRRKTNVINILKRSTVERRPKPRNVRFSRDKYYNVFVGKTIGSGTIINIPVSFFYDIP